MAHLLGQFVPFPLQSVILSAAETEEEGRWTVNSFTSSEVGASRLVQACRIQGSRLPARNYCPEEDRCITVKMSVCFPTFSGW